jgi:Rrf2 family transcriptional regulator, iron-sulfur cluster assembly transcription factor
MAALAQPDQHNHLRDEPMNLLPRRCTLAIAAVVDVAMHARPSPVAAKALAARHKLPPRHLESLLQSLVHANILKGVRGPRGGYELARERRRITAGEIVRAALVDPDEDSQAQDESRLAKSIIFPIAEQASRVLLQHLDQVCIEDLCQQAARQGVFSSEATIADFTI